MKKGTKKYLNKRIDINCSCNKKEQKKDRVKFGVCSCDAYSFSYTVGQILVNALYQYLGDAKNRIVREDWDIIEKHTIAIQEYIKADSWDYGSSDANKRYSYFEKERKWREAMFWLMENWQGLWW